MNEQKEKYSVQVLRECIDLQNKKSVDYQNSSSSVQQADYYPRGVESIYDIMNAKMLRIRSILDAMKSDPEYKPNFEGLIDNNKDLINYCTFFASWLAKEIPGQNERDPFGNPSKHYVSPDVLQSTPDANHITEQ